MTRLAVFCVVILFADVGSASSPFTVVPEAIVLNSPHARVQVLVSEDGIDRTRDAAYTVSDPSIATMTSDGQVQAIRDGATTLTILLNDQTHELPINVSNSGGAIDFLRDIRPILNKSGCASAACHAAQYGQGGLKLSVFGFDPEADYAAFARAGRQRRVNIARPTASLALRKPAGDATHGGGKLLTHDSADYKLFRDWIASGAPFDGANEASIERIEVTPTVVVGSEISQQLRVVAQYDDGTTRDITRDAKYDSLDQGFVNVSATGLTKIFGRGQTAVMIRYEGHTQTATFIAPFSKSDSVELSQWQSDNRVDQFVSKKFQQLGIEPSDLCDDSTFIRRAYLDAIGTLPTIEETLDFLDSDHPDKREQLVDRLLGLTGDPDLDTYNDLYASYWTLKWSDLIRNNSTSVGEQGMWALHNWIKEQFRTNQPFDIFVRELVTAQGSIYSNGPANFFRIHKDSSSLAEATSQLFLGVRLECAKCHHHPFEGLSQADYYGMAAFFSRVSSKSSEDFGLFGRETVVMVRSTGDVSHPRTRARMQPTPLGGEPVDHALDRRIPFAKWLTSPDNESFAKSIVNRYVGYLLGVGLVDPIDDMRSTNPPSNAELLDALAASMVQSGFDLKKLMREIMTSRAYQLKSEPTARNLNDRRFYSHYYVKRLSAEPLLDAIDRVTGTPTKFKSLPLGTRAIELPDAEYPNYFLTTFAKPRRASVCECERSSDANLAQVLHTANGDILTTKISDKNGRVAKCIAEKKSHEAIVTELYLAALCRRPSEQELSKSRDFLQESDSAAECYEDLLWALVNSKQFLHIH